MVIPLGWGYIRGFAAPKYESAVSGSGGSDGSSISGGGSASNSSSSGSGSGKKSVAVVAREVLDGKWGNGADRKKKLQAAGYDYDAVQKKVNLLLKK